MAIFGLYVADRVEIDGLFLEACRVAAEGLHADRAKVMEWVRDGDYLLLRSGFGFDPEMLKWTTISAGRDTPAGYALHTKSPVLSDVDGSNNAPKTPELMALQGVKKTISVLIPTSSGYFGVLEVDCGCLCEFTNNDVNFVSSVANLLGAAITRRDADSALDAKQAALEAANAKQTILAKEIHHRVKNGLQLVASLLSMQARSSNEALVRSALADAEMRVIAVSRVYDHLSESEDAASVELGSFLSELCASLVAAAPNHKLRFICLEAIKAPSERAIHLGLIINELVTNALKHAYPEGGGEIAVRVQTERGGRLRIEVSDRGVGLPVIDASTERIGLGAQLADLLAKLLGGQLYSEPTQPGVRWILKIGPTPQKS